MKRGWYVCELCHGERERIEIDHKTPIVKPSDGWIDWNTYIARRFVEDPNELQALCHECHKEKSQKENAIRRENKRKLKND